MASSGWQKVEVPDSITFEPRHDVSRQTKYAFTKLSKDEVIARGFTDHQQRKTERLINLPIVGIDGEGYNSADDHHYDLLAACSEEWTEYIEEFPELSAHQVFDFLLSLPEKHGKALFVFFSSTYDFTMWVKRLPDKNIEDLNKYGSTKWDHYAIKWRQGREILIYDTSIVERIVKIMPNNRRKVFRTYPRRIHIYDVFGFFQKSFVKTLAKWKTTSAEIIDEISVMKLRRGSFTPEQKAEVREYCFLECRLLTKLMLAFREACKDADITPQHWYGAGALATSLMRKFQVKDNVGCELTNDQKLYMGRAYFGGRTEVTWEGRLPDGCVQYDINSAYPTAMVNLPDLIHGKWLYLDSGELFDKYEWGVWRVQWNTHGAYINPFPWRSEDGGIYYPDAGDGIYHRIEIEAAAKLYGEDSFVLLDGWAWQSDCEHRPFDFIIERAKHRLQLKAEKNPANEPLKLGLNSLYGKTAQTVGKKPPYQNFYWAGYTTACTRAKILDAIRLCKGTVYSIATDGLITSCAISEFTIGPNLGEWEQTNITEGLLIRPGVYEWRDQQDTWHYGTRGFTSDEAKWRIIEELWDGTRAMQWNFEATRFIGLKQAFLRGENWRQYLGKWVTEPRKLDFVPEFRKRQYPPSKDYPLSRRGKSLIELIPTCWCKLDRKLSAMYSRLPVDYNSATIREDIDENQP